MFRYIENHKSVVKIILGIVAIAFITFGISTFSNLINDNYIVKLKDEYITEYQIKNILNSQDKNYSKENIVETFNLLLDKSYLLQGAKKMGIPISKNQIKQYLSSIEIFQNNNNIFDVNLFKKYLKNSRQSENQFINSIKKEIYIKNLVDIFNNKLIVSDNQINIFMNSLLSKKQVQQLPILNKFFFDKINPADDELNKFYKDNLQNYIQEESAKFEYIKITPQAILNAQKVTDDEIQKYFEKIKKTYPQRIIYDILIKFPTNIQLNSSIKKEIMQKAESLHKEIISNPENFEILAKNYSDDKSSAINGGKLGLISQNGQLSKQLEDIAFSLKIGEISNLIEDNHGFHIIKSTLELKGENFNKEKESIIYLIKQDKAYKKFNDIKILASETAFDNPSELDSTSKAIGIKINKLNEWITKNNATNIPKKVIDSLFTTDVFQQKNNSDIIDINNNESWIIRVLDTKQQKQLLFNQVKNKVINDYKNYQAKNLAKIEAQKIILSLLKKGENNLNFPWSKPEEINYQIAKYIFDDQQLNKFIETSPNNNQPNFFIVEKDEGCIIVKINKIIPPDNINIEDYRNLVQQNLFSLQLNSFLTKQKHKFKLKQGKQNLNLISEIK